MGSINGNDQIALLLTHYITLLPPLLYTKRPAASPNPSTVIRTAGRRWERGSALTAAPGGAGRAGGALQAAYVPSAERRERARRAPSAAGGPRARGAAAGHAP